MKHSKKLVAVRAIIVTSFILLPSYAKQGETSGLFIDTMEPTVELRAGVPAQEERTDSLNSKVDSAKSERHSGANGSLENTPRLKNQGFPNRKVKIVIDAGHGGRDLGAQGLNGVSEKEICLKVSRMVRRELERVQKMQDIPLEVMLSRDSDDFVSLMDRARMANEWGADLFISIHANSSPVPRVHGFEVYFLSPEATDEEASKLARLENQAPPTPISAQVISILADATTQYHVAESSRLAEAMFSAISRKIVSSGRGVRQAPFTVLHGTNMPAVLVEMGYVTHEGESKNLTNDTYLKRVANAISSGIIDFASKRRKL